MTRITGFSHLLLTFQVLASTSHNTHKLQLQSSQIMSRLTGSSQLLPGISFSDTTHTNQSDQLIIPVIHTRDTQKPTNQTDDSYIYEANDAILSKSLNQ